MGEIRPILPTEASTFLRLLCDVFELDVARAEGIFHSEPLFDLQRKWALFEDGRMVTILTTVPLQFGFGNAYGIAGVATLPSERGRGHAKRLLDAVHDDARARNEGSALLFAREQTLYERAGYRVLDEVVRTPLGSQPGRQPTDLLTHEDVVERYAEWAAGDPQRLRRDANRWAYWRWTLRMCVACPGGYACLEGALVREAVTDAKPGSWCAGPGAEWLGLRTMADRLGVPPGGAHELWLMGRDFPGVPQMFMTDQF